MMINFKFPRQCAGERISSQSAFGEAIDSSMVSPFLTRGVLQM